MTEADGDRTNGGSTYYQQLGRGAGHGRLRHPHLLLISTHACTQSQLLTCAIGTLKPPSGWFSDAHAAPEPPPVSDCSKDGYAPVTGEDGKNYATEKYTTG